MVRALPSRHARRAGGVSCPRSGLRPGTALSGSWCPREMPASPGGRAFTRPQVLVSAHFILITCNCQAKQICRSGGLQCGRWITAGPAEPAPDPGWPSGRRPGSVGRETAVRAVGRVCRHAAVRSRYRTRHSETHRRIRKSTAGNRAIDGVRSSPSRALSARPGCGRSAG